MFFDVIIDIIGFQGEACWFQKIWVEPLGLEGLPAHHPKTRDG
jgi:hypothetical protein